MGAHHRFFGKLTANELPVRGGVIKRFQSPSGDQVNFMVTIRILRPPIGSCNFFVFAPIPQSPTPPIPHKSPLPTLPLLPKQIFIVIFFNVIFTLFGFFSCGSPTRRSRKKREMVMDQEQAYEINFIFRSACDFITCVGYRAAEIFRRNSFCGLAFLLFVLSCLIFLLFSTKMIKKSPFYGICKF